jgi:nitroreductase
VELMDVLRERKSVRSYREGEVEKEKLNVVLEAARLAPSWQNKQCWSFIVVSDKELIKRLGGNINGWLKSAPLAIVACGDPRQSGDRNGIQYYLVDVSIAMQQLVLAATDLGLGTCWLGAFDEATIKQTLGIPDGIKVVAITPLGYPAEKEGLRDRMTRTLIGSNNRKDMAEIVHHERW